MAAAATHQVFVENVTATGIRIPHIADGALKPFVSIRVGVAAEPKINVSNSYASSTPYDAVGGCFYWTQTHLISFNTPVNDSKLYIEVINDNVSQFENGSFIGSACLPFTDLLADVREGSLPTRSEAPIHFPGLDHNGLLKFDVRIVPLPADPDEEGLAPENVAMGFE